MVLGLASRSGGLRGAQGGPGPTHPFRPSSCSLSPYSHDGDGLSRFPGPHSPDALPLLASSLPIPGAVATVIARFNQAYAAFLRSSEGADFCRAGQGLGVVRGTCWPSLPHLLPLLQPLLTALPSPQVVLIGDGVAESLGFDALCHSASVGTRDGQQPRVIWSVWLDPPPPEEGQGDSLSSSRPQEI